MFKKAVQQGRSERRGEAYSLLYVESLSDVRTKLADFFNILLLWWDFSGIEFQKTVASIRDMLDFEEPFADLKRACHYSTVDEKSHVSPGRAFEESADHSGIIEF